MPVNITIPVTASRGYGTVSHAMEDESTLAGSAAGLEGASQTFKRGAPLVYSSGYLIEATSNLTNAQKIVGFALVNGHNDGSAGTHSMPYAPAVPGFTFQGLLDDGGATPFTSAVTVRGVTYVMTKDTNSSLWYVNHATTTNGMVTIIDLIDPVGSISTFGSGTLCRFVVNLAGTIYS